MNPIIEFCASNVASGAYKALEMLEEDEHLDVVEYSCLDMCDLCGESMFALVNGDFVKGETAEELVKNIYKHIEENPMF